MFDWTDPTIFVYGFTVFLIGILIPIWLISIIVRIIGRSFKKTARSIRRK